LDPLTQTISLLRPRALLWKQLDASGRWSIRLPENDGVVFCLVAQGGCVFQTAGRDRRKLEQGDFLLMSSPPEWTLADSESSPSTFTKKVFAAPGLQLTSIGDPSEGPVTRILGGRFVFDDSNASLLQALLPAIVEIQSFEAGAARLRNVLDSIGEEASSDRPGRTFVLDRLLELMLVEAIRHRATRPHADHRNLLAGLADQKTAAALRALHADPRRSWSVAELAAIAGMSRSVFAERFRRNVGLSPIDYLLQWRMALAKDALRFRNGRVAEVAFACGYQSTSAFSAAFSRTVGCSPARYAAQPVSRDAVQDGSEIRSH
jgi:AraC-like DNA-binding protein